MYRPLRARGHNRFAVLFVIFFISAVFHELIVSVAFSTVSFFAFGGMLAQVRHPCQCRLVQNASQVC